MKTKLKKTFLVLLSVCLIMTMMPLTAWATGESGGTGDTPAAGSSEELTVDKTATDLSDDKTDVTLSIGAGSKTTASDVVFVLDKSTSAEVKNEALAMLDELMEQTSENDLMVNVGVVTFNRMADSEEFNMSLQPLNEKSISSIESIFKKELSSGTNIEAGIRKGMEMLENDETVLDENKHIVLVTDGITYLWGTQEPAKTVYNELNNTAACTVDYNVTDYQRLVKTALISDVEAAENPKQWMQDNQTIEQLIQNYAVEYGEGTVQLDSGTKYISNTDDTYNKYTSIEAASYLAAKAWQEAESKGYQLYAYTSVNENYPWASVFISNFSTIGGVSTLYTDDQNGVDGMFDGVKNTVLYKVMRGTVNDVIGDDFDLTDTAKITKDTFKLVVGSETVAAASVEGNTVFFGEANTDSTYPYVVTYYPEGKEGDSREQFDLEINVPVENGRGLSLTYSLDLVNKSTDSGTHTAPTNEEATLEYESTTGGQGTVDFPVPHISYTIRPAVEWDTSKSKTATELAKQSDGTYTSDVTLSLPAAEEQLASDVVFVIDKSTSPEKDDAIEMVEGLYDQIMGDAAWNLEQAAKVRVGIVTFNTKATTKGFYDLATEKDTITDTIKNVLNISGSNLHAGLLAGKEMLDNDTTVDKNRKYLIVISDGITYMYDKDAKVVPYYWQNDGSPYYSFDPYSWQFKYGNNDAPEDWTDWLQEIASVLETETIEPILYENKNDPDSLENAVNTGDVGNYTTSVDRALYYSCQTYQEAEAAGYNCYAVAAETAKTIEYDWGPDFMNYLADGKEVNFNDIQNDIYYLLAAGSEVKDYMGYVAGEDGYNFDLVNDAEAFTLKVGEKEYKAVQIEENQYGFTDGQSKDEYQSILTYMPGNLQDEEHFIWKINEPVSNFAPVQLTYTVKLTNPQTASGTYGQYDEDGSENYAGLYTNNSAVLYPVDSEGIEGLPEEFAKPTVSYTVSSGSSGGGGGGGGGTTPSDPEDPPELNTDDHFAYVIGYPEDYRTGEATDDKSLWPVKPQNNITRAEVATIFFRMLTDESRNEYWMQTNPYSDVESDMWYNNAISTLTNAGILTGYEDGSFQPNAPITRAEFAAMAARFSDVEYDGGNSFSDVSDSYWAARYIALAEYLGWINGYPDGTFRPAQNITRAESMTLVNAVLERTPDADHMLDDMITWPDNKEGAWYYEAVQEATNSHAYEREDKESPETWTEILEVRSWADLEKEWSDANSSDNPGDVAGK